MTLESELNLQNEKLALENVDLYLKLTNSIRQVTQLQTKLDRLTNAVREAINVVGGPTMDYAPTIANRERIGKIDRAVKILLEGLK
jgi:hypothetical protein